MGPRVKVAIRTSHSKGRWEEEVARPFERNFPLHLKECASGGAACPTMSVEMLGKSLWKISFPFRCSPERKNLENESCVEGNEPITGARPTQSHEISCLAREHKTRRALVGRQKAEIQHDSVAHIFFTHTIVRHNLLVHDFSLDFSSFFFSLFARVFI
jgi:hypothetical protein